MKKVIVVSKTHMDLGFTDFAEAVRKKYIEEYIPNAISLAKAMNTQGRKKFVWTTGSWIIKEALKSASKETREELKKAIMREDVVPHAMPFTTHTELLDEDTLEYGLSIVEELDKIRGRKTVAAKMTDVPGHTKAIVPALRRHGIKLLHIGVNGASALADVPPCFLWKCDGEEIVVIYSGDYGGAFECDLIEEILYFDHTLDNRGVPSPQRIEAKLNAIGEKYPDYEVEAGTMDDIAHFLWEKRNRLPVVTDEMGDTWIHGSAADPYKSAALRTLTALKREWIQDGSLTRESNEYIDFTDSLLCIAEHTCGMDMKKFFADYENYLKEDFNRARKADKVKIRHPLRDFPQNVLTMISRMSGAYKGGSYSVAEKSWEEQRKYIERAVGALSDVHREQAKTELSKLIPKTPAPRGNNCDVSESICVGSWRFEINRNGGIGSLSFEDKEIIKSNDCPIIEYRSFGKSDYDYWINHYSRDVKKNFAWVYGDFGRPLLRYVDKKYPQGHFPYKAVRTSLISAKSDEVKVLVDLKCDSVLCNELGAPRLIQIIYTLTDKGLRFNVSWFDKDANRLTEAIYLRILPSNGNIEFSKIGRRIDPYSVISMAGRKLHAVEYATVVIDGEEFKIVNRHSPVVSLGRGKILEFDNVCEDVSKDGIAYVLYNNVWGTNFPLWYEDNASFDFEIKK